MNRSEESSFFPRSVRSMAATVLICLSCVSLGACQKEKSAVSPPPPEVEVAQIVTKDVPIINEWVGTADGLVNATIRAQVTGYLIRQEYSEGDPVKKGDVLFEIDPRPFRNSLDQAEGTLAQLEAQHENAEANLARVKTLAAQNALSKKDLDDATGAERSTGAAVVAATGRGRKGPARSRFHEDHFSHRRDSRHCQGAGRRPCRSVPGRGADDGFDDRSDQGVLHDQRTGVHRIDETVPVRSRPSTGKEKWILN